MSFSNTKGDVIVRVDPLRINVMILEGTHPILSPVSEADKAAALAELKKVTGQDFGYDPQQWDAWLKQNMPNKYY